MVSLEVSPSSFPKEVKRRIFLGCEILQRKGCRGQERQKRQEAEKEDREEYATGSCSVV